MTTLKAPEQLAFLDIMIEAANVDAIKQLAGPHTNAGLQLKIR